MNRNGTINRVEIPIENNSFISDELLKNLKLYDSNDKLIGEFEKIENSIYVKLLVKIKPNKFFNREMIMRDVNNPNRVFIYPEGLGLGKGMIVRNITKNGNSMESKNIKWFITMVMLSKINNKIDTILSIL